MKPRNQNQTTAPWARAAYLAHVVCRTENYPPSQKELDGLVTAVDAAARIESRRLDSEVSDRAHLLISDCQDSIALMCALDIRGESLTGGDAMRIAAVIHRCCRMIGDLTVPW